MMRSVDTEVSVRKEEGLILTDPRKRSPLCRATQGRARVKQGKLGRCLRCGFQGRPEQGRVRRLSRFQVGLFE